MSSLPIRLYMIPGSCTDRRMFAPQLEAFSDIVVPKWLPPLNLNEPITSYALRLAATIDTSLPFALGGVSLGGMIAQQMALTLNPRALILISTCGDSRAMPWLRRMAGKLTRSMPDRLVRAMLDAMRRAVLATSSRRKNIYAQMLQEIEPHFVRWQSGAAAEWKLKGKLTMPVFQIHGAKDPIIPAGNVNPNVLIKDGGHLISATHEEEVNRFIAESLGRISTQGFKNEAFEAVLRKQ